MAPPASRPPTPTPAASTADSASLWHCRACAHCTLLRRGACDWPGKCKSSNTAVTSTSAAKLRSAGWSLGMKLAAGDHGTGYGKTTCQKHWYGFSPGGAVGKARLVLKGSGTARLVFGSCHTGGSVKVPCA